MGLGQRNVPNNIILVALSVDSCDFYIEAIKQLKARFKFTDQIYSDIQAVDPENAQRLNPVSLTDIARRYSQASWNINLRQLDEEWRSQALLQFQYDSTDVISYWKQFFL